MNAAWLGAALVALASPTAVAAQQPMDLPRIGVQFSVDHWRQDPAAVTVKGGPGLGLRYEGQGLAPITNGIIRAYSALDLFYLGNAAGGRSLVSDFTLAMSAVAPLRSGLTPYLGGGLGFVFGGNTAGGVSPIVAVGLQANRSGRIPYLDLTWYTRNNRRIVGSVGFFL